MENVIVAVVAAVPATIASIAAWRNAKQANHQTNGLLQEPVQEIRTAVLDTQLRVTRVENVVLDHIDNHNHN